MAQAAVDRITETFELTLSGLVKGYILTCKTEGKSAHTIEFYHSILRGFLWPRASTSLRTRRRSIASISQTSSSMCRLLL